MVIVPLCVSNWFSIIVVQNLGKTCAIFAESTMLSLNIAGQCSPKSTLYEVNLGVLVLQST